MNAETTSPWPLLLSKLKHASRAVVSRTELAAAGLDVDVLLQRHIIQRLDGDRWSVPGCEHDCQPNLDFDTRRDEGLVGIACPRSPACWPGWQWHPAHITEMFSCTAQDIFRALHPLNGLAPLEVPLPDPVVPVGVLKRRGRTLPVVWMHRLMPPFAEICAGLRAKLRGDGLIVLLSLSAGVTTGVRLDGDVVVLGLAPNSKGDLALWRALDALDPNYRTNRIADPSALFEEAVLTFSTVPGERHLVTINGHPFGGFQESDLKFLRLLRLAAARAENEDVECGGWLEKYHLQGDDKDHDLEDLRKELGTYAHPDLNEHERTALIKSSPKRDGTVRLAVLPHNIHFDPSLADLQLIGGLQTDDGKGKRRKTPGVEKLKQNLAKGRLVAEKLLKDCRAHGVP